ncbi:hypothetical protein NL676_030356 [Syzygium grande]|nr:hypothetical protein NL676_030356 [Syzygium grande]
MLYFLKKGKANLAMEHLAAQLIVRAEDGEWRPDAITIDAFLNHFEDRQLRRKVVQASAVSKAIISRCS